MTGQLRADVRDDAGLFAGSILVARLPGRTDSLGIDPDHQGRLVLAEGGSYRFVVQLEGGCDSIDLEPSEELFSFDEDSHLQGRLEPRQYVGRLRVRVQDHDSDRYGWAEFQIRPTKLSAEAEYGQMLEDIADVATEALLQGFAPAGLSLTAEPTTRPDLLYQQFAFIHARLVSPELRAALSRVVHNPHKTWTARAELQSPGRPIPGSSALARAVARPGPRVPTGGKLAVLTVPQRLERSRTDPSLNSVPNQFVKYALQRWRTLAQQLADLLAAVEVAPGPVRRGRDAAEQVLEQLDGYLTQPLFREVEDLSVFPGANQVLQKQHGYRQIFRTFVTGELGSRLSFDWDVDDVFAASQRNSATLYEYWCFLQLTQALGEACGDVRTVQALRSTSDGLSFSFKQGQGSAVRWTTTAAGRNLDVELFFNRTFLVSAQADAESSWSRGMRPDASIRVRPSSHLPELSDAGALDLWLHFDAKYRLEAARDQFVAGEAMDAAAAANSEEAERLTTTKREDLLKMHAYRDAIRRSAGAYVLYPGTDKAPPLREFAEILPGLGAFVLRPGQAEASGAAELRLFLKAVLEHAAERASQHERDRYWRGHIYAAPPQGSQASSELPALEAPPTDTRVLCGYVRGEDHMTWIRRTGLYNVRAGDRRGALSPDASELGAEWLLLYGAEGSGSLWKRDGVWFVQSREQLVGLGYPSPRGAVYLCAPVTEHRDPTVRLENLRIHKMVSAAGRPHGSPVGVSWGDLLASTGD